MKNQNEPFKTDVMKLKKNKVVGVLMVVSVLLFIVVYSIVTLGKDKAPDLSTGQLPLPKLGAEKKQYGTKLEALEDLREEREVNAPSIYDERLLDSTGLFDAELLEKKKKRIIDSIYAHGRIDYGQGSYRLAQSKALSDPGKAERDSLPPKAPIQTPIPPRELKLEHQLFFVSDPEVPTFPVESSTDRALLVRVDGTQSVRKDFRLRLRLMEDVVFQGRRIPRNTPVYGYVSFQPNRTLLHIAHIDGQPVDLRAFDLEDGNEGIYIENGFRARATQRAVGDAVEDINLAGLPQLKGIKQLFQRDNRTVRVTVMDNYKLILKVPKGQ